MLEELAKYARENNIPIVREQTGKMLAKICEENKPKRILEIGSAIGYSGTLMLLACDGNLVTIEKNVEMYKLATKVFEKAGLSSRIKMILGDAGEEIKLLAGNEKFDLIFLDGPKAQYYRYLPYLLEMLEEGGILFTDDIYFHGLVQSGEEVKRKKRSIVRNLRTFIQLLKDNKEFETEFFDIEDGVSVTRRPKR